MSSNTLPRSENSALLYTVSTGAASDGFRKVVKGLSKIAKDKEGLYEFGRALRKFDNADFRFRLGNYLTEISEQTLETSGKSGAAIAKKIFLVLNSSKFPKELGIMLQNADPKHAADFFADMAAVFAETNLRTSDMRTILQRKPSCLLPLVEIPNTMNSFLSARTEVLDLTEAKKLLSLIKKQSPSEGWKDVLGPNGSQKEIKLEHLTGEMLKDVDLTSYCSSLMVSTNGMKKFSRDSFPKSLHLGGDDWWPGGCCGDAGVQVVVKIKEINYPLKFSYWKDTEIWHASRGYDERVELCVKSGEDSIAFSVREHPDFVFGKRPEEMVIEDYLKGLEARFEFPDPKAVGVLDSTIRTSIFPAINFNLVPGSLGWDGAKFSSMIRDLVDESPLDHFFVLSTATLGTMLKFYGKGQNATAEARDLLNRVTEYNDFSEYDLTYYPIGVESWVKREKARKKLRKQTLHRELGTTTLDNGIVAGVSLILSKEGYVFYLNFENDDDCIKFYHSKLFQKTKWHSGAE